MEEALAPGESVSLSPSVSYISNHRWCRLSFNDSHKLSNTYYVFGLCHALSSVLTIQ